MSRVVVTAALAVVPIAGLVAWAGRASGGPALQASPSASQSPPLVSFGRTVYEERCATCHGAALQTSKLRVDSRDGLLKGGAKGPAIVPGDPSASLLLPSDQSYLNWKVRIGEKELPYGLFIGDVLNFFIVALALFFFIVKFLGLIMRSKKEEAVAPPPPTRDQELLMEIRDLLRKEQPK